jgi:adenylate cyclase
MRLNPYHPDGWVSLAAAGYYYTQRYGEVVDTIVRKTRLHFIDHVLLVASYAQLDHMDSARAHVNEILKIDPEFTLSKSRTNLQRVYKNEIDVEHFIDGLRKAGLPEHPPFKLPDKPSIAVLPFNNLSGDPAQDYIADGISENIISDLSKISEMLVIASSSTFTYKGKPVKVQQVSKELGVRYVLEGSTQKSGNRLRITAQLIDATTGHHLWSEKYDRDMKDLFVLQDEITHKIIVELQVKLTEGEQARLSHKTTTNLEAWSYAVRGLKLFERMTMADNAKAMELFKRAVELDPGYVWAWVRLAWTHLTASRPGWSPSPSESYKKAVEISQKLSVLDESDSDVCALVGHIYLREGQYEQAITEGQKSIVLGPTNAVAHVLLAAAMNVSGRFNEAIELVKKAMRIHPYYPAYYLQHLGEAYHMTGRYEDALTVYKQLLDRSQKGEFTILTAHIYMVEVYMGLGREKEARTHTAEVLKLDPKVSLKQRRKIRIHGYKDAALLERRLNALRKAGIPE